MVDSPYSGTATRAGHFASRPSVPGLNKDHITPDPEPDIFNPVPDMPANQAGFDAWTVDNNYALPSNQPNLAPGPGVALVERSARRPVR
jgi:hypothetical protein